MALIFILTPKKFTSQKDTVNFMTETFVQMTSNIV